MGSARRRMTALSSSRFNQYRGATATIPPVDPINLLALIRLSQFDAGYSLLCHLQLPWCVKRQCTFREKLMSSLEYPKRKVYAYETVMT